MTHASRRPLLLASGALALSAALPALGQTRSEARAGTGAGGKPPAADFSRGARLEQVAAFPDRQITGITVSRSGRVFVCLPRWGQDVTVSVAELAEGQLRPFPDEGWRAWRNASPAMPERRFVCVQSVVVDPQDNLWVLDPAAPDMMGPVKGGPKLVRIDLRTNTVAKVIPVPERVAPPGSYLNDLRFSPDGRTAYITDSGIKGALVVLDTASGAARRVLDCHPSTQFEEGLVPMVDGQPLRRPNGRTMQSAADGIAISPDGAHALLHPHRGAARRAAVARPARRPGSPRRRDPCGGRAVDRRRRPPLRHEPRDERGGDGARPRPAPLGAGAGRQAALARHLRPGTGRRPLRHHLAHPGQPLVQAGSESDALRGVADRVPA